MRRNEGRERGQVEGRGEGAVFACQSARDWRSI